MKKKVFIGTIIILLIVSIFTFYEPAKKQLETSASYDYYQSSRTLYWGSRGQDVKNVQWKLRNWKYYDGKVDGVYGARTYRAVRRFQKKNGLKVDGVVGEGTARAMGLSLATTSRAAARKTSTAGINRKDDVYLLARAIHGEARGEPYVGKVAVGAVILNRTRHPSFPNTVAGVIYQPLAFTAVADGQINMAPGKDSIKAARDALNGWDPTYGCTYYWNPATATSRWIWSRKVVLKIGKHWFGR
ncbi:spore cortex-lytic enzyme [Sporanaerobacter acetigenes]|uniref:Spore cortex-lytic enzyme n=1 Tax=Sporanaerobacter acetigenes DSM 13106 TaxID=1123281 RepID=A0A1M5VJJ8_9FIRM|nr:spore cortex-lytic enzyme [Sporanaerobacter acetigenes]SHH75387.1 N-acetylmuramoyl-L-alanine amidase [Sporanaerobacter acetigenes DSM 13106]